MLALCFWSLGVSSQASSMDSIVNHICKSSTGQWYFTSTFVSKNNANVFPDLLPWPRMCHSVYLWPLQNSSMAAISSGDVRSYGIVGDISCPPWPRALWDQANARSHRIDLAGIARFSVYPWSWALCCEFFPSKVEAHFECWWQQARWPERAWPGSFDIWGSSHQLFHILVVLAAASHLYGLLKAFDYHHGILGLRCWPHSIMYELNWRTC